MAEQILDRGAKSFNAGSWSGSGFGDGAELAVLDSEEIHADLDRAADTTTGNRYLHFRGGRPTVGDETNGDLEIEMDPAYTAKVNFLWATLGGKCRTNFVTNTCTKAVYMSLGGHVWIVGGTITKVVIAGGPEFRVTIMPGVTIGTSLEVLGSPTVMIREGVAAIPGLKVYERARVHCVARPISLEVDHLAEVTVDNRSGSSTTTTKLNGGTLRLVAGDHPSVEWNGGRVDDSRVNQEIDFGGTSLALNGSRLIRPQSGLVTVGTPTEILPAVPILA